MKYAKSKVDEISKLFVGIKLVVNILIILDEAALQLRQIWESLAVGESGYINLPQLSIVCEHIGMDGMTDNDLEILFSELDKNGDGLVSFDEFLEGLFLSSKRPLSEKSILSPRGEKSVLSPRESEQSVKTLTPVDEMQIEESQETLNHAENVKELEISKKDVIQTSHDQATFKSSSSTLNKDDKV